MTCWCTAKRNVTTWSSISVNNSKVLLSTERLGPVLWLPLCKAAGHLRRLSRGRMPMTVDWIQLCAIAHRAAGEGHADRTDHYSAMVVRARRSAARGHLPSDCPCHPRRGADLEAAGIQIIQIDEPALREGLPLRQAGWTEYLDWAVRSSGLPPRACATRPRSTRTCAIRSSTTSSMRSPPWMPT